MGNRAYPKKALTNTQCFPFVPLITEKPSQMLDISWISVLCGLSQPFSCQSFKLIFPSFKKYHRRMQDFLDEVVVALVFVLKSLWRDKEWIYLPITEVRGGQECFADVKKCACADDKYINIAICLGCAVCFRAINEMLCSPRG